MTELIIPEYVTNKLKTFIAVTEWIGQVTRETDIPLATIRSRVTSYRPPIFPTTGVLQIGKDKIAVLNRKDAEKYLTLLKDHIDPETFDFSERPSIAATITSIEGFFNQHYTISTLHEAFEKAGLTIKFRTFRARCTTVESEKKRIPTQKVKIGNKEIYIITQEDGQEAMNQYREEVCDRLGISVETFIAIQEKKHSTDEALVKA
jgi:hypothetical protein